MKFKVGDKVICNAPQSHGFFGAVARLRMGEIYTIENAKDGCLVLMEDPAKLKWSDTRFSLAPALPEQEVYSYEVLYTPTSAGPACICFGPPSRTCAVHGTPEVSNG